MASARKFDFSSNSWVRRTRAVSNHCSGVVPVCVLKYRLSVRVLVCACSAIISSVIGSERCSSSHVSNGAMSGLEAKGDTMLITELLIQKTQAFGIMAYFGPILVGLIYITLMSLISEPSRKKFNAVMSPGRAQPT